LRALTPSKVLLPYANFIAPCTIATAINDSQFGIFSTALHHGPNNLGLILMPAFTYKSGQLYLLEHQIQKVLSMRQISLDMAFGLIFEKKSDARDDRPCILNGRIAVTSTTDMHKSAWRHSSLVMAGRTEPAKQVPGKSLITVEDLSEDSLPRAADGVGDTRVQGGHKFQQIGDDAAHKLLQSTVGSVDFGERTMVMVVDVNPNVGNMLNAFLKMRGNMPLYYFGICDNNIHESWLSATTIANALEQFTSGKLLIPGVTPATVAPPEGVMEVPPSRPALSLMVWMRDMPSVAGCPQGIKFPRELLDRWHSHEKFGDAFRTFYTEVLAVCGEETDETPPTPAPSPSSIHVS
jgi:hypothetical protein